MNPKRERGNPMDTTTLILAAAAAILLAIAFWQGRDLPLAGLLTGGRTLWRNLPLLLLGFAIAGLAQVLIPRELITRWLGTKAGGQGHPHRLCGRRPGAWRAVRHLPPRGRTLPGRGQSGRGGGLRLRLSPLVGDTVARGDSPD